MGIVASIPGTRSGRPLWNALLGSVYLLGLAAAVPVVFTGYTYLRGC